MCLLFKITLLIQSSDFKSNCLGCTLSSPVKPERLSYPGPRGRRLFKCFPSLLFGAIIGCWPIFIKVKEATGDSMCQRHVLYVCVGKKRERQHHTSDVSLPQSGQCLWTSQNREGGKSPWPIMKTWRDTVSKGRRDGHSRSRSWRWETLGLRETGKMKRGSWERGVVRREKTSGKCRTVVRQMWSL